MGVATGIPTSLAYGLGGMDMQGLSSGLNLSSGLGLVPEPYMNSYGGVGNVPGNLYQSMAQSAGLLSADNFVLAQNAGLLNSNGSLTQGAAGFLNGGNMFF